MNTILKKLTLFTVGVGMTLTATGCATNAGNGALIGGAAGAGLGAIVGNNSRHGSSAGGALIGGALGAITGAIVANEIDRSERRPYYGDRYVERRHYDERPYPEYRRVDEYGPGYHDTYYERVR